MKLLIGLFLLAAAPSARAAAGGAHPEPGADPNIGKQFPGSAISGLARVGGGSKSLCGTHNIGKIFTGTLGAGRGAKRYQFRYANKPAGAGPCFYQAVAGWNLIPVRE